MEPVFTRKMFFYSIFEYYPHDLEKSTKNGFHESSRVKSFRNGGHAKRSCTVTI